MAWNNRKKRMGRTIIVEDNNVNRAISALKHVMAPVLKELKQRKYYEKPSEKDVENKKKQRENCVRNFV